MPKKTNNRYKSCDTCGAEDGKPCLSMTSLRGHLRYKSEIRSIHSGRKKWTEEEWRAAVELAHKLHKKRMDELRETLNGYLY